MAANSWPEKTRIINTRYPRLDGLAKAWPCEISLG